MARLPAFCGSCAALIASPLRADRPEADNAFAVPVSCPVCGEGGQVPAEIYRRTVQLVRVLLARPPDEEELDTFRRVVGEAAEEGLEKHELVSRVLDEVPALGRISGVVPEGPDGVRRGFLKLVSVARAVVEDAGAEDGAAVTEEDELPVEELAARVLEEALERHAPEVEEDEPPPNVREARRRMEQAGRNDPCPCGSGQKYKRCHWLEDQRTTRA